MTCECKKNGEWVGEIYHGQFCNLCISNIVSDKPTTIKSFKEWINGLFVVLEFADNESLLSDYGRGYLNALSKVKEEYGKEN